MAKSTYPYDPSDKDLRRCTRCRSRLILSAMCDMESHNGRCRGCCSELGYICNINAVRNIVPSPSGPRRTPEEASAERIEVARIVESLYGPSAC